MKLLKSLAKLTVLVVVILAAYVGGLLLHIIPQSLTPQVLFASHYNDFKAKLEKKVASDSDDGVAKSMLDSMNKIEASYKSAASSTEVPAPKPAPDIVPVAPEPGVPSPTTPTLAPSAPIAPGTPAVPATPATPADPTLPKEENAVDKAKAVIQQYQNNVDEQKQTLDNL